MSIAALQQRLAEVVRGDALVSRHDVPVLVEAEEHDIVARVQQELARGGLHILISSEEGTAAADRTAGGALLLRERLAVSVACVPGLAEPVVSPLALLDALVGAIHDAPAGRTALRRFAVTAHAPLPDDSPASGHTITVEATVPHTRSPQSTP